MSEENTGDLGDDLKDKAKKMANEAGEKASELADKAKEAASEASEDIKEGAKKIQEEAKEVAGDIKEEWNKVTTSTDNKKLLAGLLAIFLGSLGIHKFILGYQKEGIILLVGTVIGYATLCIGIGAFILMATGAIGLIEGIIYLVKSDEEFYNTYQANQKPWF